MIIIINSSSSNSIVIQGNEQGDRMTKSWLHGKNKENRVTHTNVKMTIESAHNAKPTGQLALTVKARTGGHLLSENWTQPADNSTCRISSASCHPRCAPVKKQNRPCSTFSRTAGITSRWGRTLTNAFPDTRKAVLPCGCCADDHRFHRESCFPSVTSGEQKLKRRRQTSLAVYLRLWVHCLGYCGIGGWRNRLVDWLIVDIRCPFWPVNHEGHISIPTQAIKYNLCSHDTTYEGDPEKKKKIDGASKAEIIGRICSSEWTMYNSILTCPR